ncbi:DUF2637 domain-containing protein [Actinoplanes sp. NPDC000266]
MILERLRRVRWAVRATLLLGVAASVVANILHALDNPISQAIAAWPPLALLLTVELISRVPVHHKLLAAARFVATATIAGIAAWVSYWHMVGVAARYGETGASPYLLPLSVDGLIVVASICLVELGGRISTLERSTTTPAAASATTSPSAAFPQATPQPTAFPQATPQSLASPQATSPQSPSHAAAESPVQPDYLADISDMRSMSDPSPDPAPLVPGLIPAPAGPATTRSTGTRAGVGSRATTAAALAEVAAALPRAADDTPFTPAVTRQGRPAGNAPRPATGVPRPAAENPRPATGASRPAAENPRSATGASRPAAENPRSATGASRPAETPRPVGAGRAVPAQRTRPDTTTVSTEKASRPRRTPAETVTLAHEIRAARPDLTEAELASELGISLSRWRTIRREAGDQTLAA